jgi:adenylate kinase family enzyme
MKKVLVIGSGGAGKSTFSGRLSKLLEIEVIHLDVLYWNPGWIETPKPEWRKRVEELLERETWIMDGNYSGTLDIRLEACDTVVFLDLARTVCLWRVLKRAMLYRNGGRPDMAQGCHEKLSLQFMRWIWGYPKRTRPKVLKLLRERSPSKGVIRLRTQAEIERFLAVVGAAHPKSAERTAPEDGFPHSSSR